MGQKFEEEYYIRAQENSISIAFGDIMYRYLGSYKYDNKIFSISQLFRY